MPLTLIVNAKVNTLLILVYNGSETGEGVRFGLQIMSLSLVPPMAFGVTILLDDILIVEVVRADLPRNRSGLVTDGNMEVCSPLFPRSR